MENDTPEPLTLEKLAAMIANADAEVHDQFATLESHIGDIEVKLIAGEITINRRIDFLIDTVLSAKAAELGRKIDEGFAALRAVLGGLSHTLSDHEERLKELEGE